MSIKIFGVTTILAGGLLTAYPAMALRESKPDMMTSASAQSGESVQQLQETASQILGNINIANMDLRYGMYDDALSHIHSAHETISTFNQQVTMYNYGMTPYSSSTTMTAAKLGFKTDQGEFDYWIPIVNDRFVVRTVGGQQLISKHPDIDFADAQIVHYKVILDTNATEKELIQAQTAIDEKKYDVAMNALQNISKGSIAETVVEDRPLEAVRDNLILSRELLRDKDYQGASLALKHAGSELAKVDNAHTDGENVPDIKDIRAQIDALQVSIAKEDPSMLIIAETKIDDWIKNVKAMIHS